MTWADTTLDPQPRTVVDRAVKDVTDGLQALISRDFQFAHPRDSVGSLVAVVGLRVHHGVIDIVQLYGEDDADAARIPGDEPDVLFPQTVIWRTTGLARDVIQRVLSLEDPVEASATSAGCWLPTHAGRSTWLAASA